MPVCGGERGYLYTDLRPVQIKVHTIEARLVLLVLSLFLTVGTRSDLAVPGCGGRLSRWGGSQVAAGDMGSRSLAPGLEIPSWCRGGQGMVLLERAGFGGHPTSPKGCLCFSSLIFQWSSWFLPGMELLPGTELLWCPYTGCVASSVLGCLLPSSSLCFTLLVAQEQGRPEPRLGDSCSGRLPAGWRQ